MSGTADAGFDRGALRRSFDRASAAYDGAARLQREVRTELLSRLEFFQLEPAVVVDLGAGTGEGSLALRRRFPRARTIAVDLAPGMLRIAHGRRRWWRRFALLCADANAVPLADASVDVVFSNLMLQWCERPVAVFAEIRRILRPGGLLLCSTFGPDTLHELRAAWGIVDDAPRVSEFPPLAALAHAMIEAGLAEPVIDVDRRVEYHADVRALAESLRRIGAHNALRSRPRGLTGRSTWTRFVAAYEAMRESPGLPATYEVLYAAAFAGSAPPSAAEGDGTTTIPVSAIRRANRGAIGR